MPRQVLPRQPLKDRLRVVTVEAQTARKPKPKQKPKPTPKRRKDAAKKSRPGVTKPAKKATKQKTRMTPKPKRVTKPAPKVVKTPDKIDKPKKRGAGRPKFRFDAAQIEEIEKLAGLQCTRKEVAGWFRIAYNTLKLQFKNDKRVEEAWENGRHRGTVSLRRYQFALAQKNATMAIFLGKQILGQKDDRFGAIAVANAVTEKKTDPNGELLASLQRHKLAVGETVH